MIYKLIADSNSAWNYHYANITLGEQIDNLFF